MNIKMRGTITIPTVLLIIVAIIIIMIFTRRTEKLHMIDGADRFETAMRTAMYR